MSLWPSTHEKQGDNLRDFVFPLALVSDENNPEFEDFVGTGFLFGAGGFALTAAHVLNVEVPIGQKLVAMFVNEQNRWELFDPEAPCVHPEQDVALFRIPPLDESNPSRGWKSPFRLRNKWEGSSRKYEQWGYPSHALFDSDKPPPGAMPRPDLIYASGYIRRRVAQPVGADIIGDCFYELSERAGSGCSGGPVYVNNGGLYDVLGVYVGERVWPDGVSYAYAANEQCIRDWRPASLGKTLLEQGATATR